MQPDSIFQTQVFGDGVLTLPPLISKEGDSAMNADVKELLMTDTVGNIQRTNAGGRDSAQIANSVLQFAAARNFDELGTVEGRANAGVNGTPIAGPTQKAE